MHRHHFLMQWTGNATRCPNPPTSQCKTSKIQYHFPNWLVLIVCHLPLNWTPRVMLMSQLWPIVLHARHAEPETNKSKLKILLFLLALRPELSCVRAACITNFEINWIRKLCLPCPFGHWLRSATLCSRLLLLLLSLTLFYCHRQRMLGYCSPLFSVHAQISKRTDMSENSFDSWIPRAFWIYSKLYLWIRLRNVTFDSANKQCFQWQN